MKRLILFFVVLGMVTGCITFKAKTNWCDKVPEDSYSIFCELSKQVDVKPEYLASIIRIANIAAISNGNYTAQDAADFLDSVEEFIEDSKELPSAVVLNEIKKAYVSLPIGVQAVFMVLDGYADIDIQINDVGLKPLSDFDIDGAKKQIQKTRAEIALFLIK